MGLRDLEQLYNIKLLIHMLTSICLVVWIAKKEKKIRYHQLLFYLTVLSGVLTLVE